MKLFALADSRIAVFFSVNSANESASLASTSKALKSGGNLPTSSTVGNGISHSSSDGAFRTRVFNEASPY